MFIFEQWCIIIEHLLNGVVERSSHKQLLFNNLNSWHDNRKRIDRRDTVARNSSVRWLDNSQSGTSPPSPLSRGERGSRTKGLSHNTIPLLKPRSAKIGEMIRMDKFAFPEVELP